MLKEDQVCSPHTSQDNKPAYGPPQNLKQLVVQGRLCLLRKALNSSQYDQDKQAVENQRRPKDGRRGEHSCAEHAKDREVIVYQINRV